MAMHEKSGVRDLIFNTWHRPDSIGRFISAEDADAMRAIDIDLVEYHGPTGRTVLIHEVALDIGQSNKQTLVLRKLAEAAGCWALCTLYKPASTPNPADTRYKDIESFRMRVVWRTDGQPIEPGFRSMTPAEYAAGLNATLKQLKANLVA